MNRFTLAAIAASMIFLSVLRATDATVETTASWPASAWERASVLVISTLLTKTSVGNFAGESGLAITVTSKQEETRAATTGIPTLPESSRRQWLCRQTHFVYVELTPTTATFLMIDILSVLDLVRLN